MASQHTMSCQNKGFQEKQYFLGVLVLETNKSKQKENILLFIFYSNISTRKVL